MKDTEKFYPLKGFETYYEITESGRFRRMPYTNRRVNSKGEEYFSTKPCLDINGFITKQGYRVLHISIKDVYSVRHGAHVLVAKNFIPNPDNLPCVNHKDGNKLNNHVSNLEYCTYSYNNQHRYDELGYINKCRKLSDEAIIDIYENAVKSIGNGKKNTNKLSLEVFAKKYNVNSCTISEIVNNKTYKNITKNLKRKGEKSHEQSIF